MKNRLLQLVRGWFGRQPESPAPAKVADYWNQWQQSADTGQQRWLDWGEHPSILACIYRQAFGAADYTLFHYLHEHYPGFAAARALSLCSGDGKFEKLLVENGIFAHVTGLDLAAGRVEAARRQNSTLHERLDFVVGDVNTGDFGTNLYEVVFAKAALHHVGNLEQLFAGIRRALVPGGHLVTIDYFGPSRFQWLPAQLQHANTLLGMLPEALRRLPDGTVKRQIERPTIAEMLALDPSEAIRSDELATFIKDNFSAVTSFDIGGTLLQLVFTPDILNNFRPEEPQHVQLIEQAYAFEQQLIERGELSADFRLVIAS